MNELIIKDFELDIEKDIDEKGAARVLEDSTQSLPALTCIFTVVPNAFLGLEATETTCFDLIIVRKDLPHLNAFHFLKILRNVGAPVELILLVEANDPIDENQALSAGFFGLLRKEYQALHLCNIITNVVSKQETQHLQPADETANRPGTHT